MCHRGAFREDIIKKCVFCKTEDNGIEYVTNNCIKFKKVREELIDKLNKLDANTKNKTLLEIIEYYYYSKKIYESKAEKNNDNNVIKLKLIIYLEGGASALNLSSKASEVASAIYSLSALYFLFFIFI